MQRIIDTFHFSHNCKSVKRRMKFTRFMFIFLISLSVAGCSSKTETLETNSILSELKSKACNDWATKTSASRMTLDVAKLFQRIAEQDSQYVDLSKAAFYLYLTEPSVGDLRDELVPQYLESLAEVYRHCTSDAFLSLDSSETPGPEGNKS